MDRRLRALIVDDERLARKRMRSLLEPRQEVDLVAEAATLDDAVAMLQSQPIDLVFLDVQLRRETGFDLFDRVELSAAIIFVTAHDEYALRAFDVNALDYLLKPVSEQRLAEALARAQVRRASMRTPPALQAANRPPSSSSLTVNDLVSVKIERGVRFVRVADISHITAADDYSEVHLTDQPQGLLCATPIAAWIERLPQQAFVQIHRSAIVQLTQLESVQRLADSERWEARLRGDVRLPVSRRFARALRQRFDF